MSCQPQHCSRGDIDHGVRHTSNSRIDGIAGRQSRGSPDCHVARDCGCSDLSGHYELAPANVSRARVQIVSGQSLNASPALDNSASPRDHSCIRNVATAGQSQSLCFQSQVPGAGDTGDRSIKSLKAETGSRP